MSLNLHALAADIVREATSPEPDVLAAELVSQLDPADYREALTYLARNLIRSVIHDQRTRLNGGSPRSGSKKIANARAAWQKLLDSPEYVPSAGWLFLRDATHDQVLEMAGMRMQKSRELAAAAKQYKAIAEEMKKADAATVSDLPVDMLERLLAPAVKAVKAA